MLGNDARDAGFDDDDDVAGAAVANTAGKYTTADFLFYSLAKVTPAAASAIRDTIDAAVRALNKNLCEHVPIMSWKYDVAANGHSKFCDTATAALKAVLAKIESDPQDSTARATVVNFAERSVAKFTTAAAAAALSLGPDRQRYDSAATVVEKEDLRADATQRFKGIRNEFRDAVFFCPIWLSQFSLFRLGSKRFSRQRRRATRCNAQLHGARPTHRTTLRVP